MWLFFAEFLPELLSVCRDLKNKGKIHALIFVFLFILLCITIYHDIYLEICIPIIISLFIFTFLNYFFKYKEKYVKNDYIKIHQELTSINKKIPIKYQQILGSSHNFVFQGKEFEFLLLGKDGGNNYMKINGEEIYSLSLSPIFHYGVIFYQKVIDVRGNRFNVKVTLSGYLSPYLMINIKHSKSVNLS